MLDPFDGATAKLYINGTLDSFEVWEGALLTTNTIVTLGKLSTDSWGEPEDLDEARLYNRALTPAEVAQLYFEQDSDIDGVVDANASLLGLNPLGPDTNGYGAIVMAGLDPRNFPNPDVTSGLVGWWTLDETSGTTIHDATTNAYNLTLHNGGDWVDGLCSNALWLDGLPTGSGNYGEGGSVALGAPLQLTNVTVAVWGYVTNTYQGSSLVGRLNDSTGAPNQGYELIFDGEDFRVLPWLQGLSSLPAISMDYVQTNAWNHFAFTYDGAQVRVYQNGKLRNSVAFTNSIGTTFTDPLYFGSRYQGAMDDVRIYNRALSPADIATLAFMDTDHDGLPNILETQIGSDPNNFDTVGDGISDGWKLQYGLSITDPGVATATTAIPGVDNLDAYLEGYDPTVGAVSDTTGQLNLTVFTPLE